LVDGVGPLSIGGPVTFAVVVEVDNSSEDATTAVEG